MKIYEIGTGYTSIPARMGAATEIVVEELTRSLCKCGHDVAIVDIKDRNRQKSDLPIVDAYMPQFFSRTDTKLGVVHKLKRVLYSLSLTYKLHQLLRREKRQVVLHFHNQYNLFFYLKFTPQHIRRKTTIIYTVHSYIWQGKWEGIKDIVQARYFQEIECCRKADRVFVLNELTKQHFVEYFGISESRIQLIANGVNTDVYYPMGEEERLAVKRKLGLEGKTVFFQAGSVCERKNQLASLKLLSSLLKSNKDVVYLYAGGVISSSYKAEIDHFIAMKGITEQVVYAGELMPGATLNEYYNASEIFLFPSSSEGFSLVILEAMSAGLTVIVDANSRIRLPQEGRSGCFSYLDEKDFLQKVDVLLSPSNENSFRLAARGCIVQNYSWDSVARDYVANI
jgi:glycosyltransferase involved in cell wall biosynthesis